MDTVLKYQVYVHIHVFISFIHGSHMGCYKICPERIVSTYLLTFWIKRSDNIPF